MKLVKISDIFYVQYGVNLELNKLTLCERKHNDSIPFISRTEKNNGLSAYVLREKDIPFNPANTISVACSGSVLSTFYQEEEYYSGRDLYVLSSKFPFNKEIMLAYCTFIKNNKNRFSYGRQANKTLNNILVPHPDSIPKWVHNIKIPKIPSNKPYHYKQVSLQDRDCFFFKLKELFTIQRGKEVVSKLENGDIPLISSTGLHNGLISKVKEGKKLFNSVSITVANNGSIGSSFYQDRDFYATTCVTVLSNNNINQYNSFLLLL